MSKGKRKMETTEAVSDDKIRPNTACGLKFCIPFQKVKTRNLPNVNADSEIVIFVLLWVLINKFLCYTVIMELVVSVTLGFGTILNTFCRNWDLTIPVVPSKSGYCDSKLF